MQGNEHEQEFNDVKSEVIETLKQSYDVDVCPESTYSCPMVWWYHRQPTVEKDIEPFVRLFDKTRKAIFDLLADYVNLASIDSSIFSLDHCYSIYDINNCDAMISGYPSFIMSINVLLEECRYIENSLDVNELMSGFFRVFKHFLKKNLSFFLGHNHDKYEMNIKTKIGKGQRIICELDNSDCKMEKNYLKCLKKIDNYITNLNEKYNLKSNNLLRESVKGLIKRFEMLVNTKKAILNNKVKRIRTVVYHDGENNKNDNGFNDGDFMKNKLAKTLKMMMRAMIQALLKINKISNELQKSSWMGFLNLI